MKRNVSPFAHVHVVLGKEANGFFLAPKMPEDVNEYVQCLHNTYVM
jgi:hypothetical protein